ncbi:hypothetical protein [Bradyrhizobium erythrophlei]|jgi:hypothetical protein|uniref:Uncharacterized protein n=1 Tax=Bradyrhizobium erythrophlei TaxID=1437360 RepID=A0A1M5JIS8_9BRAD|nr:hypothetical protein [Bradyrhizobium erythrophlei]SHG40496.1 hypothetical protein SAMN05443248_1434 [Bradyrhizobium erythrophlei]
MPDSKSRARVERMLRGDMRPDDLTHLFLYARDRCDGRESVQEIGDFVAHHAERNKGIVTESTREWFAIARFSAVVFTLEGTKPLDPERLPAVTPSFLSATLRRIDNKQLRAMSGLSRVAARKALPALLRMLRQNADGTYSAGPVSGQNEVALLRGLSSVIIAKAAFDGDRLFADFSATLKSNALVIKSETDALSKLQPVIELFAIAAMHNCRIQMDDGSQIVLKAAPSDAGIDVNAAIPTHKLKDGGEIFLSSSIFKSKINPKEFCEPNLLESNWSGEIELSSSGRLSLL